MRQPPPTPRFRHHQVATKAPKTEHEEKKAKTNAAESSTPPLDPVVLLCHKRYTSSGNWLFTPATSTKSRAQLSNQIKSNVKGDPGQRQQNRLVPPMRLRNKVLCGNAWS